MEKAATAEAWTTSFTLDCGPWPGAAALLSHRRAVSWVGIFATGEAHLQVYRRTRYGNRLRTPPRGISVSRNGRLRRLTDHEKRGAHGREDEATWGLQADVRPGVPPLVFFIAIFCGTRAAANG